MVVACATLALASCSSSGRTHTQSFSPSPSVPPSTSTVNSSPSTSPASSTRPPRKDVPTPTVTASAQGAVNAYIAFYNSSTLADRDPAHADLATLNQYLTGKALTLFDGTYKGMKRSGLAYRGTPPAPRVKISSVLSSTAIFLSSCPLVSKPDPYVEYHVSTKKVVATGKLRSPAPPYLLTLPMKKVFGKWKLTDVVQDTSKTCKG
jgi:hypothetical protein